MRISDWSSDVCSSDLIRGDMKRDRPEIARAGDIGDRLTGEAAREERRKGGGRRVIHMPEQQAFARDAQCVRHQQFGIQPGSSRSEEHTSELQSLMRISYAVFCLNKKKKNNKHK